MARVNHKKVNQLVYEEKDRIPDRKFFSSRILAGSFEDIAAAQTGRYKGSRRIRANLFWKPKDEFIAATDNTQIRINCGHKMVTKNKGRVKRYMLVKGMFAHELGHILYTDFLALQVYRNAFEDGRWYPVKPDIVTSADVRREKELWEYVTESGENRAAVEKVMLHVSNILEDGYIENRVLNNYPGELGVGLDAFRKQHFDEIATVTQLIEREEDEDENWLPFESIMQMVLSYAKFGEIKYGDEPISDKRIQLVFSLVTEIDRAVQTHSAKERFNVVNLIMIRCWDYAREFCEFCKEYQKNMMSNGELSDIGDAVSKLLRSLSGMTEAGEGDAGPLITEDDGEESSATAGNRMATKALANPKEESEDGSEPENSSDEKTEGSNKSVSSGQSEDEKDPDQEANASSETIVEAQSSKQQVTEKEKGRIPLKQTETVSDPVGGGTVYNDDYKREIYENAAKDIENVLETMAEKAVCRQLENERLAELNEAAQSISYGDVHSGVNIRINRITEVDEELVMQYEAIAPSLLTISRQLQSSIKKQLKESRRGGKQTGLFMGRRLDSHALHRNDGRIFYKNSLPNEIPELAVGLLLDESGSMSGCNRCTYARASAIILHDFCESLDIPVMVYGHSTGYGEHGHSVELYSYAEFEGFDRDDKYRLMDIAARGGNRDGAALRFVAEQLAKRPEEVKLLILVSDGQPADFGYDGTAAEEDLRGIKHEYNRKGIILVAAAIGNDKPNIERIYGDSFLDITDLSQLPVKLTSVVKKHIKI